MLRLVYAHFRLLSAAVGLAHFAGISGDYLTDVHGGDGVCEEALGGVFL
jgi:hypothetical protein